jgi:hypothetical protein
MGAGRHSSQHVVMNEVRYSSLVAQPLSFCNLIVPTSPQ